MANELIISHDGQLIECHVPALIADAGKPAQTAYDDFLDGACRTENTRRAYKRAIAQFMEWASEQGLALAEIRAGDVGRYLKQLPGKTSSKKQHRAALKRFFDILVERHVCLINPAAVARTEKLVVKQGLTPEIEKDEIQTLLASLQGETLSQLRDRAIIGILIYTACRAGAISKLRRGDYHGRPGNRLLHLAEKGGNSQKVPVRSDLEQWIDEYIQSARIITAAKDSPLFRPLLRREQKLQSQDLRANDVCRLVKRKLREAEIRAELSAHSFRVATITDLLSQGIAIEDVQELAGHADSRTTKLYDRTNREATRNLVERISF